MNYENSARMKMATTGDHRQRPAVPVSHVHRRLRRALSRINGTAMGRASAYFECLKEAVARWRPMHHSQPRFAGEANSRTSTRQLKSCGTAQCQYRMAGQVPRKSTRGLIRRSGARWNDIKTDGREPLNLQKDGRAIPRLPSNVHDALSAKLTNSYASVGETPP